MLCQTHNEDSDNLLFGCDYSKQIRMDMMQKLNINTGTVSDILSILEILWQQ